MPPFAGCVFRCFKVLERFADRITGAAGPVFVTLAWILMLTGIFAFFDVIQPELSYTILSTPLCLLIIVNMLSHYYLACTVPPGFTDSPPSPSRKGLLWAQPKMHDSLSPNELLHVTRATIGKCQKCGAQKPERAHHCRICKRCVIKYDHHCPWINQCVGLHNERHFVLFMSYLVVAGLSFVFLGWQYIWHALGWNYPRDWSYTIPSTIFILIYVLALVLSFAVGLMLAWHSWAVMQGETSVEGHDHDIYRRMAKDRGETFVNSYDLGKKKNLQLFFNIGPSGYPWYTLILPLRTMPYTDGFSWARKAGFERHRGIRHEDELTEEEDEV